MARRSLIAIVTPAFCSAESVEALKREVDGASTEIRLVAPAVEINPLHHTPSVTSTSRARKRESGSRGRLARRATRGSTCGRKSAIPTRCRRLRTRC